MLYDVVSNCASSWYQPVAPLVNAPEPDMQPEPIGHGFMFTYKFIIYAIIYTKCNYNTQFNTQRYANLRNTVILYAPIRIFTQMVYAQIRMINDLRSQYA